MAAFLVGNALTAARARLPHPARRPLPQRAAARRLLRRRLAGRRLAGRPAPARPGGQLGDARPRGRRMLTGVPGRHLARPAARLAVGLLAGRRRSPRSPSPPCSPSSRRRPGGREATVRGELGALRRPQVILTLLVGVVGFGGMFAALQLHRAGRHRRRRSSPAAPCRVVLLAYGAGGVVGTALGGRLADLGAVPLAGRRRWSSSLVLLALVALISPWAPGAVRRRLPRLDRARRRWPSACRCG